MTDMPVGTFSKLLIGEWVGQRHRGGLVHRWLREDGIATIRIRFLDDNSYEQEVAEVAVDGMLIPESYAVMKRDH